MSDHGQAGSGARTLADRARSARTAGRRDEAGRLCAEALALSPGDASLWALRGTLALDRQDLSEAIASLRQSVTLEPHAPAAWIELSRALGSAGDADGALAAALQALGLEPGDAAATFACAIALQQLGRCEESLTGYRHFLRTSPANVVALTNGGEALRQLRQFDEARAWLARAIAARADYAPAHNHLGLVELDLGRLQAAAASFAAAVRLTPALVPAIANHATVLLQLKRDEEAAAALARLAQLKPDFPYVDGLRLYVLSRLMDWRQHRVLRTRIAERIAAEPAAPVDMPHACLGHEASPVIQRQVASAYCAREFPAARRPADRAAPGERLRIGYFSNDFGDHAVSYLVAGVLESHDRARFEWHGFGWQRQQATPMRERIVAAFTRFHDITGVSDAEVLARCDALGLDIAVDLTGLTGNHRTRLFAGRAAPVQVSWLGFPGTMGAAYVDYLIADRRILPDEHRSYYAEQPVWMPVSFQPFDNRRAATVPAPARTALGLAEHAVVLAAFNDPAKLTPEVYAAWLRILKAAPEATLWLLAPDGAPRRRLLALADAARVARRRIVFADPVGYAEHRARLGAADLFLDTSPFSAGATQLVPVLQTDFFFG